jgi:hypothetical protein
MRGGVSIGQRDVGRICVEAVLYGDVHGTQKIARVRPHEKRHSGDPPGEGKAGLGTDPA